MPVPHDQVKLQPSSRWNTFQQHSTVRMVMHTFGLLIVGLSVSFGEFPWRSGPCMYTRYGRVPDPYRVRQSHNRQLNPFNDMIAVKACVVLAAAQGERMYLSCGLCTARKSHLGRSPNIDILMANPIIQSVCYGGLEFARTGGKRCCRPPAGSQAYIPTMQGGFEGIYVT